MKAKNLKWEYEPSENPDWDFARNNFTVLKRTQGTLTQSIFSVYYGNMVAPNRDYKYQGLLCFSGNEYWKFLDCIFFEIIGVKLKAKKVVVYPWKCVYQYVGDKLKVNVEYYLARTLGDGLSLRVLFDIKSTGKNELVIKPLLDIREVYQNSSPQEIAIETKKDTIIAKRGKNFISFNVKDSSILEKKEVINWKYKLGDGFRKETKFGIRFISEYDNPVFIGEIRKQVSGKKKIALLINCNSNKKIDFKDNENKEIKEIEKIMRKFKLNKRIQARIIALNKFGVRKSKNIIPEAGDFWFKEVWFRDLFEGLLSNFKTYMKIDKNYIGKILNWSMKKYDNKTGRFPNFLNDMNSADATFLFFLLAERYIKESQDKKLAKGVLNLLHSTIETFSNNKKREDGPPVIKKGLVYSMPWHSWTDKRILFMNKLISARIPSEWLTESNLQEIGRPCLLPEINALFIRALYAGENIAKVAGSMNDIDRYRKLYNKAVEKYKRTFMNNDFLYSIVVGNLMDENESSVAVISAVLLYDHVFDNNDLKKMWPYIQSLLVKRRGRAFGILVRNSEDKIFLNDDQYHGSTVWPRDTPYLIKYLRIIGKNKMVRDILENQLEHQMNEGAILLCHELFSLPEGKNPSSTKTSKYPVPVKNPIQFWSHFCDEYLK